MRSELFVKLNIIDSQSRLVCHHSLYSTTNNPQLLSQFKFECDADILSAEMVSRVDDVMRGREDMMAGFSEQWCGHDAITQGHTVMENDWNEVPGAEILKARQIEERPHRDFLMHQQGFMSGKTEGDLDSVPGYYAGTASYKFVQNAKHLNKQRVTRYETSRVLGEHHDEYGRVISDTPGLKQRLDAFSAAAAVPYVPYSSIGPNMAFKMAGEHGAFRPRMYRPQTLAEELMARGGFRDGIYVSPQAARLRLAQMSQPARFGREEFDRYWAAVNDPALRLHYEEQQAQREIPRGL